MKLTKTYKFSQFAQPIVEPETVINTFIDEEKQIHLNVVFTSENPHRGVYLGIIESVENIEQTTVERLAEFKTN